jgi:hypothetical protein
MSEVYMILVRKSPLKFSGAGPSGRAARGVGPDRLDAETVGSSPAESIDVCLSLFFIFIYLSPYHQRYIV